MTPDPPSPVTAPILAGRYRLERVLGQGGMGTVYLGEHLGTGRKVAVKVLRADLAKDPTFLQRFQQEARASVAIDHPGVVDVFDSGVADDGSAFMVMELLRGESLGERLSKGPPLGLEDVVWIGSEALAALAAAHAKGVLHRDLKPDNLFLVAEPQRAVKLVDFGISKLQSSDSPHLTQTGMVMGTPTYMAPEQARGKKDLGPGADLYSMGVILYHALSGRPPFTGDSLGEVMAKVLTEPFVPLRQLRGDLPPAMVQVVESLLERDPAHRPTDATAVRRALEASLPRMGQPTGATAVQPAVAPLAAPAGLASRLGPNGRRTAVALGVVLLVGLLGRAIHHHRQTGAGAVVTSVTAPALEGGEVYHQPISGLTYVRVPKGSFIPGCLAEKDCPGEPKKEVAPFWIDATPVSVREYQLCVDGHHCRSLAKRQESGALRRCNAEAGRADHPLNCVTWGEAQAYCRWAGEGRLPTAMEWEFAARGGGQDRAYPWGDAAPTGKRANFCDAQCQPAESESGEGPVTPLTSEDDGFAATSPVGSYAAGATEWGLLDMAGDVAEWTGGEARPSDTSGGDAVNDVLGAIRSAVEGTTSREVRGGSFASPPEALKTTASASRDGAKWGPEVGFRCVVPLRK